MATSLTLVEDRGDHAAYNYIIIASVCVVRFIATKLRGGMKREKIEELELPETRLTLL